MTQRFPRFDFCDELNCPTIGMVIDNEWYKNNHKELTEWCNEYGVGMTTSGMFFVPDMATRTLMTLRWA